MERLKHILVGIALLVAMLPCAHALEHHDHGHDSALELCGLGTLACECHSCDHHPCSADVEIQLDRAPVSDTPGVSHPAAVWFPLPKYKPACRNTTFPVSGVFASIQTVQLLI